MTMPIEREYKDLTEGEYERRQQECLTVLKGIASGENKILAHPSKAFRPGYCDWESPIIDIRLANGSVVQISFFVDGDSVIDYIEWWCLEDGVIADWCYDEILGTEMHCPTDDLADEEYSALLDYLRKAEVPTEKTTRVFDGKRLISIEWSKDDRLHKDSKLFELDATGDVVYEWIKTCVQNPH